MSDAVATALVRTLVIGGAAGVYGRWLMRSREPRAVGPSRLRHAPYAYWVAVLVIAAHPVPLPTPDWYDAAARPLGLLAALAGGLFAAWAALHLGRYWDVEISALPDHRVVDDGPFAVVRHPIYLGLLAFLAGATVALGDGAAGIVSAAAAAVAVLRARAEERFLTARLGDEYRAYALRVGMLLPRLR